MSSDRLIARSTRRGFVVGGTVLAGALAAHRIGGAQARPMRIGLLHPVTCFVADSGA